MLCPAPSRDPAGAGSSPRPPSPTPARNTAPAGHAGLPGAPPLVEYYHPASGIFEKLRLKQPQKCRLAGAGGSDFYRVPHIRRVDVQKKRRPLPGPANHMGNINPVISPANRFRSIPAHTDDKGRICDKVVVITGSARTLPGIMLFRSSQPPSARFPSPYRYTASPTGTRPPRCSDRPTSQDSSPSGNHSPTVSGCTGPPPALCIN